MIYLRFMRYYSPEIYGYDLTEIYGYDLPEIYEI